MGISQYIERLGMLLWDFSEPIIDKSTGLYTQGICIETEKICVNGECFEGTEPKLKDKKNEISLGYNAGYKPKPVPTVSAFRPFLTHHYSEYLKEVQENEMSLYLLYVIKIKDQYVSAYYIGEDTFMDGTNEIHW